MISLTYKQFVAPANRHFEVVERKGLGHPDTMSDLIAEEFSFLYSRYCIEKFGQVLNHAVDKVTLIGASTKVWLGGFDVIEPASILLIGKITPGIISTRVPVHDIFREAVTRVIEYCLPDSSILKHTNLVIHNTFSSAVDRSANFYLPNSIDQAQEIGRKELGANDTVFCTGSAERSPLEKLVLDLELAVTAPHKRVLWPTVGTDVKVMVVRQGIEADITMCVPVDPRVVQNRTDYENIVDVVRKDLERLIQQSAFPNARLNLNTKDADGGMYLAPFGTSFGKSDCGAVGRGNRLEGFIAAFRPTNIEAPSGKNPLHHAGKLYTIAAQQIADEIFARCDASSAVSIVARNGDPLSSPAYINIDREAGEASADNICNIASNIIENIGAISNQLITKDPLAILASEPI